MVDIGIVGGGLLGTAIARDAALRGLSVALYEKNDFASGASGRLDRLVPGRLSALQTLDFTHVREHLREREVLQQIAPHLTASQPCLVPFYQPGLFAQARIRAALALADALSLDASLPLHQLLSPPEARAREPSLRAEGLAGAALLWEVTVPRIERLALEMALDARDHGASLHTHTPVERLRWAPEASGRSRATGLAWKDGLTGESGITDVSVVVVAAGAWQPTVDAALAELDDRPGIKSIFVIGPPLRGHRDALAFSGEEEGHLIFALPWGGRSWIGSLETDMEGDLDTAYATGAEVQALVQPVREFLPDLDWNCLGPAQAAVCAPLPPADFPLPRAPYQIVDYAAGGGRRDGLLSVLGGSLASCRMVAEETVDLACRKLGRAFATPPCRTASTPLPGAVRPPDPSASLALPADEPALRVRVERAVGEEECRTLGDFLQRRSSLFWSEDQGQAAVPVVLETMASLLNWDRERQERERKAYAADVALTQAFRVL